MGYNLGLNLVEIDGKVTPSIQPAATSVAGMLITSERGVPDRVVKVTNWTQFINAFGGYIGEGNGAYAVRGFFDNGGQTAYLARVVNDTQGDASMTTSAAPFSVAEGATLTFMGAATVTFEGASPARQEGGTTVAGLPGQTIEIIANGGDAESYTFSATPGEDFADPTAPTLPEAVNALNREISAVRIYLNGSGNIVIRTDEMGTDATLAISGAAAATLGVDTSALPDGVAVGSGNVDDVSNISAADLAQVFEEELGPHGFTVSVAGDTVTLVSATGIDIDDGDAAVATAFGLSTAAVLGDGSGRVAAVASSRSFGSISVEAGNTGMPDPGAWGDQINVSIETETTGATFTVEVYLGDADDPVETFEGLSMDPSSSRYVETVINDGLLGSGYIVATDVASDGTMPTDGTREFLGGGNNGSFGSDPVTAAAAAGAVFAAKWSLFELHNVQLIACPESHDPAVISGAITHAELMGDRMLVGHTPNGHDNRALESGDFGAQFQGDKQYGALYFPWISISDPIGGGRRRLVPPDGHVMGVYARTERERGIQQSASPKRRTSTSTPPTAFVSG